MEQSTERQERNLLEEDFDLFIAYHGTNDKDGSMEKAREIYYLLSKYAKCFFKPVTDPTGRFSNTPKVASHSKLFLLVANPSVEVNRKQELASTGLFKEVDGFYQANFSDMAGGSARVYAYDGLTSVDAEKFHLIFRGAAHFSEEESDRSEQDLVHWVQSAIAGNAVSSAPSASPEVSRPLPMARQAKHPYEGIWVLSGNFTRFQGANVPHTSAGRLVLMWRNNMYKALYCYSVSRAFQDSSVTAICEGGSVLGRSAAGEEQLVVTCNIIARTTVKKMRNSSMQFQLVLTPQYAGDGSILSMTSEFKTANTDGVLRFIKGD